MSAERFKPFKIFAEGTQTLKQGADGVWHYELSASKSWFNVLEQASYRYEDGRVKPIDYLSYSKYLFYTEKKTIEFDHQKNKIFVQYNKDKYSYDLKPGIYDGVSFQPSLYDELAAGETTLNLRVFRHVSPLNYQFKIQGHEILNTPMGKLDTLVMEQTRGQLSGVKKRFWLAVDYNWLVVKLEEHEDGDLKHRIVIKSAVLDGQPVKGN